MAANFSLDHGDLTPEEIARAADVATRAFIDDKYFRYLMADERVRARTLPLSFRANCATPETTRTPCPRGTRVEHCRSGAVGGTGSLAAASQRAN